MKRTYIPQLGKYENTLEAGDSVHLVVDDETADRIRKEVAKEIAIRDKEVLEALESVTAYMPLMPGLKAPNDWHEDNFKLGMDSASAKDIFKNTKVENEDTLEMEDIKEPAGVRGAVASGKRQDDGTIIWDWNDEEEDVYSRNLLDFYVLPEYKTNFEDFYSCMSYNTTKDHMPTMPNEEYLNPLMVWKDVPTPTPEEREILNAKAVENMREAECEESEITAFIEKCKTTK